MKFLGEEQERKITTVNSENVLIKVGKYTTMGKSFDQ
jgi:hypothetical protein